jgi:uncharacterized membrane protein (UPF0127 family)
LQKKTKYALVVIAIIGLSLTVILTRFSGNGISQARVDKDFLQGVTIPSDKYLKAKIFANKFELTADLALTPDQQTKGLAVKDNLKENEGMLFVFASEGINSFWMKDMKFPIDIIWMNSNRTVIHIEHSLKPCPSILDCPTYSPSTNSNYVLEAVSGFAAKHQVVNGTMMDFELIG